MNIHLTPEQEEFVKDELRFGKFQQRRGSNLYGAEGA